MHVIRARNVNDAYAQGYDFFKSNTFQQKESRAGLVMEAPFPVTTWYERPEERVLFNARRDANPFFHLFEALWMLAGRKDVEFLRQFSEQAAKLIEGESSYGHRWVSHFGFDQISVVIDLLKRDPQTRRAVLTMWDPKTDLASNIKDIPCNDLIQFSLRRNGSLDMQVFCRSNDMIWGAYGANAVHMSILQEYVAAKLGVLVGHYWQISANFHVYMDIYTQKMPVIVPADPYVGGYVEPFPIVQNPDCFDSDLKELLDTKELQTGDNLFLEDTAGLMWQGWRAWKAGLKTDAMDIIDNVVASDWRVACHRWMERRL